MAVRAIWIIGTAFSGSTLVQFMAGRFGKVLVAGEIDRIRAFNMHPHLAGNPVTYRDSCEYCRAKDVECPVWTPALFDELGAMGPGPRIYETLARVSRRRVVVDASKTPWWFLNVARHPDFAEWKGRVLALHCVRHPFAFAVSMSNRTGASLEQCVLDWVIINRDAVAVIQGTEGFIPTVTVLHNAVLNNPRGLLDALSCWGDLGPELENRTHHFLGGNAAAYQFQDPVEQSRPVTDDTVAYFSKVDAAADDDGRWRSKIDHGMRWRLAGLPGVREMCGQLGINIDALITS